MAELSTLNIFPGGGFDRTDSTAAGRRLSYWVVGAGLTLGYFLLRGMTWQGGAELHTLMEGVATVLAVMVGVMALARNYSQPSNTFLFIGTGFLGTAFLDGYHTVVTSKFFALYLPSALPSLIPWSWVASRMFLSVMLLVALISWMREQRLGEKGRISECGVYVSVAAFTVASFLYFAFVPLPRAYYPELPFHRPEEFVPAVIFLLALIGYLSKGKWRTDPFEHWLVISLIVAVVSQAVFMSFSGQVFDLEFDLAHLLKKVSYICVLIGLFLSMYSIFQRAEESKASLAKVNLHLQADIADRKEVEKQLRESKSLLQAILDYSPTKIHIKDTHGRYVLINRVSEMLFGVTNEKARGKTSQEIFPQTIANAFSRHDQSVMETGQTVEHEEEWFVEDNPHTFLTAKFPILDTVGNIIGTGAIGTDITERKRMEEAMRVAKDQAEFANRSKSEFLSNMSHELRTPLNAIIGFSEMMMQGSLGPIGNDQYAGYIEDINASGQHLLGLISDILDLSKIEAGKVDLNEEEFEPAEVIQSCLDMVKGQARSQGLQLEMEIPDQMSLLHADQRMFKQILLNLLSNAVKFTPEGGMITVKAWSDPGSGHVFQVIDTGIGVALNDIPKILRPFTQIESAMTRKQQGTGLGLPLVKNLIELQGGYLDFQSEVGVGSTVTVRFPKERIVSLKGEATSSPAA